MLFWFFCILVLLAIQIVVLSYFGFSVAILVCVFLEIYWMIRILECVCAVRYKQQIPFVATNKKMRRAVIDEINKNYSKYKTLCEIGSGYGGLARAISRKCKMHVCACENMPFTYMVARVADFVFCACNVKTLYVDAFEYLAKFDGVFDVAVAYLGPVVNDKLVDYMNKFRVLILIDVPLSNVAPVRIVNLGPGYTSYGRNKYPHKLFIYEK